jgi:hypothetical protein
MTLKERVAEMVHKFAVQLSEEKEAKLASAVLENGQEIQTTADAFAEGVDVFVVNDQGENIPLPDGDYTLEDGSSFTVTEGVISAIGAAEPAEEVEAKKDEEELAEEGATEQALSRKEVKEMIATAVKEATTQLSAQFAEQLAEKDAAIQKLSAQPAAKLSRVEKKETFSRQQLAAMSLKERVRALSN